jgi:GNAT superfamily N-acetyltransferase
MRIVRADAADQATTRACFEAVRAAGEADDPLGPPWSLRRLRGWMEHPADPSEVWICGEEAGAVQGWYYLILPERENRERGHLYHTVRPAARRRGIGTALLRHAAGRAARAGRPKLGSGAFQDSPGAAFAVHAGAIAGLVEARRVQVLGEIPAGRIASRRQQAAQAAAGYSLVSWDGRIPGQYLAGYASVRNAMADAPHDASGEMAALTEVEPDPDHPEWGYQQLTAVTRGHRGHRLGLLVKTAMLDWLAVAEPALEQIVTGNAEVNQHMIAINEELGYRLRRPLAQTYELPVAEARG